MNTEKSCHSTDKCHPCIEVLLGGATARLESGSARLDAEVLMAFALGKPRSFLYAWPQQIVTKQEKDVFLELISRRAAGVPVAYLTGVREFWSLPLAVSTATLIPRPETETLVALALEKLPADRPLNIADLGTGCGAIALAIANERPLCRVTATDISYPALQLARDNARRLGIHNVNFIHADWCSPLFGAGLDLIVSNPPYIPADDPHLLAGDVRFEPGAALCAGPLGTEAIMQIARHAHKCLGNDGWLMLEHGYDQGGTVTSLLEAEGYHSIGDHRDSTGLSRVSSCRC